jgi:hypothetical protein
MIRLDEFETRYLAANSKGVGHDETNLRLALAECVEHFHQQLSATKNSLVASQRSKEAAFESEVLAAWGAGFDELEVLVLLCDEIGQILMVVSHDPSARSWKHQAMFSTHARCMRVAKEVVRLLKGGFADGSLGRWRTLHELAVILNFIEANDEELARRYVLHRVARDYRAAVRYQKHHSQTRSPPIDEATLKRLQSERDALLAEFGKNFEDEWGWASQALAKTRVRFSDIEAHQVRDMMRPNYKWASEDIHGAFSPSGGTLGTVGGEIEGLLNGASLTGLLDPAYWTALALMDATTAILKFRPTLDRIALMTILTQRAEAVGQAFHRIHTDRRAAAVTARPDVGSAPL